MRLKIAPNDAQSMSQDGDAILRSLQNKSLPLVDLMVRESLQNSLDATLESATTTKVDFSIKEFKSEDLAPHFETISDKLVKSFPGKQVVLSVSDKNTSGLTGDFTSNEKSILDKSNFQKLVFGIGKNQNKEGAGGSWGLGKTSYFRMGVGIVIYYTRIQNEFDYEERLIASLIESPTHDERLLGESERGIAWWGEFDSTGKRIYPITDHEKIMEVLKIFGLQNYEGNETGTTIIIPYLKPVEAKGYNDDIMVFPWEFDRENALSMAVQRWYNPRIWNEKYSEFFGNSQLDCSINGISIHPKMNMEPVFKIFQNLYNAALIGEVQTSNINVEAIKLPRNAMENSKNPVGYIAFCEVSREELKMTAPDNKPSALAYLGIKDKAKITVNTSKVIAYSRMPGMVVEYSVDGDWTPTGLIQKEDHLLFGFFVPNSKGVLLKKFQNIGYKNLENYLRATENADHANWVDDDGIGIIRRMKNYSANIIQNAFQDSSRNEHTTATSSLSRKFGTMLMPPKNFGKTSSRKKLDSKLKLKVESRNRISDIIVTGSSPIDEHNVNVTFKAFINSKSTSVVFVQVLTQEKKLNKITWHKAMGEKMDFPFSIQSVFLKSINGEEINQTVTDYSNKEFDFNLKTEYPDFFEIKSKVSAGIELNGILHLKMTSNQYLPNIAIRTEMINEEGEK